MGSSQKSTYSKNPQYTQCCFYNVDNNLKRWVNFDARYNNPESKFYKTASKQILPSNNYFDEQYSNSNLLCDKKLTHIDRNQYHLSMSKISTIILYIYTFILFILFFTVFCCKVQGGCCKRYTVQTYKWYDHYISNHRL